MKKLISVFALLTLASILNCGSCCSSGSDEDAIRNLIDLASRLAEKHDISSILDLATQDFRVKPRGKTRQEIKRLMFWAFNRYGRFSLLSQLASVEVNDQDKTAVYYLLVRRGKAMPEVEHLVDDPEEWLIKVQGLANLFRVRLDLIKTGGDWKFQRAQVERFKGLKGFE
ncbi:MAG: nuclear transport factor 2 family protein [Deltaproteobacteria bacterium]|nr:nuclear transport factor 2 family protein [Deltaproteobacteria bacterium]